MQCVNTSMFNYFKKSQLFLRKMVSLQTCEEKANFTEDVKVLSVMTKINALADTTKTLHIIYLSP